MIAIIVASCNPDRNLTIREVYTTYTSAVVNSDIQSLFSTITRNGDFNFITSQGNFLRTRKEYYYFHELWFREKGWKISFGEPVIYIERKWGLSIAEFHYQQELAAGKSDYLDSFFTLIYHKENGKWKIVADFCTPIRREIE